MKKLIALRFLFLHILFLGLISLLFPSKIFASHKTFQENFETGNLNNWTVKRNSQYSNPSQPCLYESIPTTWNVENGKAGIKINGPSCTTEIIPNNFNLSGFAGYSYSFDMEYKNTAIANRNILFKYLDSSNWYDFMTYGTTIYFQKVVGSYYRVENKSYPFQDNQDYHFKIDFYNNVIKLYINNIQVWELEDSAPYFNEGTIGLQASVGADPDSEVWFDNILVTNIDTPLNVPLLKQTADPWQSQEYDTASNWSAPEPSTISRWGCAIASTTMVLNYHGVNKLPDGTALNPGSLNSWLKQNDGYVNGGNLDWSSITRLAKLAKDSGNNPSFAYNGFEFVMIRSPDKTQLRTDLDNSQPDILEVANPQHFIVAKGIKDTTFDINDPYHDRTTLTDGYADTFVALNRFIPSNTNLSYIWLYVDPTVDILLTNSTGQRLGGNSITTYSEISSGNYYIMPGITNPVTGTSSPSTRVLMIPKPGDDTYSLSVATTSTSAKDFSLKVYRYKQDGTVNISPLSGQTRSDEPATFSFEYKQNPSSTPPAPTDTTPPQIKSSKTLDTNNNGKIDTIEVTFARDINGTTVNSTGTDFTVVGYTVTKAKETSPGVVQITVTEKTTTDTGTTPTVTLKNNSIKDITSDTYNHQQVATPIDGIAPTKPTADIEGGKYITPQKVSLASSDVPNTPTISYTLDGSDPATSSAKLIYTAPIEINGSSVTLKAVAKDTEGNISDTLTEVYEIAPKINDSSIIVASSSTTSFTITWTTDRLSHSRMIFGTKSKKVKGSGTNYGYDKSTIEATQKKTSHSVTITGLTPGGTYYYRVISRGSPEQVGEEKTITLPKDSNSSTSSSSSSSTSSSNSSSINTSSPVACNDTKPKSAPVLLSAFPGINTVTLAWKEAEEPVSYYLIAYGTEPGKIQYGNPNIGGKGMTSFVVENLSGGQTYYFKVRAGNGCTPGDFSNELSATPIGFAEEGLATGFTENVLGTSTINNQKNSSLTSFELSNTSKKQVVLSDNNLKIILGSFLPLVMGLIVILHVRKGVNETSEPGWI